MSFQVGGSVAVDTHGVLHIPKFTGEIWFVDDSVVSSGDGTTPHTAFKTIGEAVSAASAGDAISIKAGTYAENVVMSLAGLELWPELGVVIAPPSGVALTVSANYCKIWSPGGSMFVTAVAGQTGVEITGNRCYMSDVRCNCASSALLGFDLQGNGAVLDNCRCAAPLTAAFKIQGDKIKLEECGCAGESGDSSIGYWITNACDKVWLLNCSSRGNETAGYYVDTGCTNGIIKDCATGRGDGRWVDVDDAFVWSNFTYDHIQHHISTFTATGGVGGAGTNYNLFKVNGSVQVFNVFGIVETVMPATNSTVNLELYSTNGFVDITDSAGAPDLISRVVGTTLVRNSVVGDPIDMGEPSGTPAVIENASFRSPQVPVVLVEDSAADTYIQAVLSAPLASGAIHWRCEWAPASDDGFLEPV